MTDRELMRMALDALEHASAIMESHAQARQDAAITALRERLAQEAVKESLTPEAAQAVSDERIGELWQMPFDEFRNAVRKLVFMARTSGGTAGPDHELIKACDAVVAAQPSEPKPVAWRVWDARYWWVYYESSEEGGEPLYAAPPPAAGFREGVEAAARVASDTLSDAGYMRTADEVAKAIRALLKEKDNG